MMEQQGRGILSWQSFEIGVSCHFPTISFYLWPIKITRELGNPPFVRCTDPVVAPGFVNRLCNLVWFPKDDRSRWTFRLYWEQGSPHAHEINVQCWGRDLNHLPFRTQHPGWASVIKSFHCVRAITIFIKWGCAFFINFTS